MDINGKSKLTLHAPAKVNLRLKVKGRRWDGYHDLDMIVVKVSVFDDFELEMTPSGWEFSSDSKEVPSDRSNLLWKAADLLRKESGKNFGLRVRLRKRIPVAAGLGGGSSDAASLLLGLHDALGLSWPRERLRRLAVKIGADVPFFLESGPQRATGVGEVLSPIQIDPIPLILINPGFPVPTADVYRWYDETSPQPPSGARSPQGIRKGEGEVEVPLTGSKAGARSWPLENDLEKVVIPRYSVLADIKRHLVGAGALGTLMSGSGPTIFGTFPSEPSRDRGYKILLEELDPKWWACKCTTLP